MHLQARPGEKLVFPTIGVTVHVLAVKGDTVWIGVEAPPDVAIRGEEPAGATADHHRVALDRLESSRLREVVQIQSAPSTEST